ncbi:MAG: HlyD family efflux transporter periplasmic adaptor subunit [Xanthomonadaceae bacterium]|jgi:HlyD family secretion protein|nr:HlyD family efflux transporter periplasmic adaptor subunit [Xanthomonadaceae bacterium]
MTSPNESGRRRLRWLLLAALPLAACKPATPEVLGTLEWDRITLPAPAAERIVSVEALEGDRVAAGAVVLRLEAVRADAQLEAAQAQAGQSREALLEMEHGPRIEAVAQARAQVAALRAQAVDARSYSNRLAELGRQRLVAAADADRALASAENAEAQVRAAQEALLELERGTRAERIAQGQAAVVAADADAAYQSVTRGKLDIIAPRAGRIDSLPYKLGDQAPAGTPLAIMLVGEAPYARVYVPAAMRARIKVGQSVRVFVDGYEKPYAGHVRVVRSDPVFTPYYALTGDDTDHLSYLAEILLTPAAADLPLGVPVRVELPNG